MDRLRDESPLLKPLGCAAVQSVNLLRHHALQMLVEHIREEVMVAIPVPIVVQGDQKEVLFFQLLQHRLTIDTSGGVSDDRLAERAAQAAENGSLEQKGAHRRGLLLENLFEKVRDPSHVRSLTLAAWSAVVVAIHRTVWWRSWKPLAVPALLEAVLFAVRPFTLDDLSRRPTDETFNKHVRLLTQAWAERRIVTLDYAPAPYAPEAAPRSARVRPYLIEPSLQTHALYLIGWDETRSGMRTFKIERIVKLWLETPFEGGRHARRVEKILNFSAISPALAATLPCRASRITWRWTSSSIAVFHGFISRTFRLAIPAVIRGIAKCRKPSSARQSACSGRPIAPARW